ncbi:44728_t:CDS:2, partial [Gigaspora margarita]
LYERYEKWKNKTHAERQNILNLNQQILALHNNQQNRRNMAGIPQPFFDWGDNIPDFFAKLRLYLQNQGVNLADNAAGPPTGREVAIGYLRGCMRGRTLKWPEELHRKFLDALPLPWLEKAEDIGEHLPLNELAKKLYEIELH